MKKIGTLILAIGLVLGFSGCKTETEEVTLEKIEITAQPSKTEYFVGEELDTTGLEVTATYSDESTKVVTGWTTTGYDKEKTGEQTVIVSYTENEITQTAGFDVTVKAIELTKIEVTKEPAKKEYFVGAKELDLAGMVVTATYSDGKTADVTKEVTTSGFESSAATESQTITVTYGGKTATFTVKILAVELTKIEITTEPTRKVYYIGSSALDLTGMVVTATYNNGTTADVTKDVTISGFESSTATESQTITVTYGEKTASFIVKIVTPQLYSFHETVTTLPEVTTGSYGTDKATYVEFGDWPQDVVPVADVAVLGLETSTGKVTRGYMEFVQGLDGNYYVKCNESRYESSYTYTKDGSAVGTGSRWFKVMPIKWRVVDTAYKDASGSSQGKLLVAENILTANVPYYDYGSSSRTRTVGEKNGIYPNNYEFSQIRAYLNGLDYYYDTSDTETTKKDTYTNKGFLQTAFTSEAAAKINTTKVDNAKEQMSYNGTNDINEEYACGPTDDKIFLLSEKEVVKYSKKAYTSSDNSRIRVTTDFAKANYALQSTTDGWGGYWWLRSPYNYLSNDARNVDYRGDASLHFEVETAWTGVVPALSISF